jgi:hypothetical protein
MEAFTLIFRVFEMDHISQSKHSVMKFCSEEEKHMAWGLVANGISFQSDIREKKGNDLTHAQPVHEIVFLSISYCISNVLIISYMVMSLLSNTLLPSLCIAWSRVF